MDFSTAVFSHGVFAVKRANPGGVRDPAMEGPDVPGTDEDDQESVKQSEGGTLWNFTKWKRFKRIDTGIRSINHAYRGAARFLDNQGAPIRHCYRLSSDLVNAVLTNQRLAEFVNNRLAGLKDQQSILHPYFERLIDLTDHECSANPVGIAYKITMNPTIFGYTIEAGFSVVACAVVGYREGDAQTVVDVVYEASDTLSTFPWVRKGWLKSLYRVCSFHDLPPSAIVVELLNNPADVTCAGGFANVFKYTDQGLEIAVKVLRTDSDRESLQRTTRRFYKEAIAWKSFHHPNVLPLLGVQRDRARFMFAMASAWMANGRINQFVAKHRDADRFKLLADAARGLTYLHSQEMVHGDLKGDNILIDESGNARLADFGMTRVPSGLSISSSPGGCGTTLWMSPELFDPTGFGVKDARQTKSSDCYALGITMYEVLSGRVPYFQYQNLTHYYVMGMVLKGERPKRLLGVEGKWLTDNVWEIMEHCWKPRPGDRPGVECVLQGLEEASRVWTLLPTAEGPPAAPGPTESVPSEGVPLEEITVTPRE